MLNNFWLKGSLFIFIIVSSGCHKWGQIENKITLYEAPTIQAEKQVKQYKKGAVHEIVDGKTLKHFGKNNFRLAFPAESYKVIYSWKNQLKRHRIMLEPGFSGLKFGQVADGPGGIFLSLLLIPVIVVGEGVPIALSGICDNFLGPFYTIIFVLPQGPFKDESKIGRELAKDLYYDSIMEFAIDQTQWRIKVDPKGYFYIPDNLVEVLAKKPQNLATFLKFGAKNNYRIKAKVQF